MQSTHSSALAKRTQELKISLGRGLTGCQQGCCSVVPAPALHKPLAGAVQPCSSALEAVGCGSAASGARHGRSLFVQARSLRRRPDPATRPARPQLSPECKDLLNKIFVIDAKKRISIEQIERHPWWAGLGGTGGSAASSAGAVQAPWQAAADKEWDAGRLVGQCGTLLMSAALHSLSGWPPLTPLDTTSSAPAALPGAPSAVALECLHSPWAPAQVQQAAAAAVPGAARQAQSGAGED